MAITARAFDDDGGSVLADPADISRYVDRDGCVVWVDVLEPDDDDFTCLAEELTLHHLALDDARKHGQRTKLEHYPNHSFIVAYSKEMAEVDLFLGTNWLITVREHTSSGGVCDIEAMRSRYEAAGKDGPVGLGYLVYTVLDEIVDGYVELAETFEQRVRDFETRVLSGEPAPADSGERLIRLRRELVDLRRVVFPLAEILHRLVTGELTAIDAATRVLLQDVEDHVLRVVDELDTERELVSNVVEAHQALQAKRLNEVMKRMTSWGALLLGSTLVAGIYGMNFEHMPELDWLFGYPWALGLMLLITVVGYGYFKRRDWL
jgi:magnesium transporter